MIERTVQEGILTVRLAHGKASAMDVELLEALEKEFVSAGDEVRAIILTGTGTIFCAGVDLLRLTKEGEPYVRRFLPLLSSCLRMLFAFPKPVVVAANGHAIAGGCLLVQTGDVRLMAEGNGKIGIPELLVGVPFPASALELVRFAVPPQHVQSLVYSGKTVVAKEALNLGLVDEVLAPENLMPRALEHARQLAAIPAETFRLTKQALRAHALARVDGLGKEQDQDAAKVWLSPQTHATIREYLQRTMRK